MVPVSPKIPQLLEENLLPQALSDQLGTVSNPSALVLLYFMPLTLSVNLSTALSLKYLLSPVICPLLSSSLINLNTSVTGANNPALPASPPQSAEMLFMTSPCKSFSLKIVGGIECFSASEGAKEMFLRPNSVISMNISQVQLRFITFKSANPRITIPSSLQTHLEPVGYCSFQLRMQLVMLSWLAGSTAGASSRPELCSNRFWMVISVLLFGKKAGQYLLSLSEVWMVPLSYSLMYGPMMVNICDSLPRSNLASIATGGEYRSCRGCKIPKFLVQRVSLEVATPTTPPGQQPLSMPS